MLLSKEQLITFYAFFTSVLVYKIKVIFFISIPRCEIVANGTTLKIQDN